MGAQHSNAEVAEDNARSSEVHIGSTLLRQAIFMVTGAPTGLLRKSKLVPSGVGSRLLLRW